MSICIQFLAVSEIIYFRRKLKILILKLENVIKFHIELCYKTDLTPGRAVSFNVTRLVETCHISMCTTFSVSLSIKFSSIGNDIFSTKIKNPISFDFSGFEVITLQFQAR